MNDERNPFQYDLIIWLTQVDPTTMAPNVIEINEIGHVLRCRWPPINWKLEFNGKMCVLSKYFGRTFV